MAANTCWVLTTAPRRAVLQRPRPSITTTLWGPRGEVPSQQRLRSARAFSPPLEQKSPALSATILICKELGHDLVTPNTVLEKLWSCQKRSGDCNKLKRARHWDYILSVKVLLHLCIFPKSQTRSLHARSSRISEWVTRAATREYCTQHPRALTLGLTQGLLVNSRRGAGGRKVLGS